MISLIRSLEAAVSAALIWLILAAPALAQSPADCPRHRLETETVLGTYLGRGCPDVCYFIVQLDGGEKLLLMDSPEGAGDQMGPPGGLVRVSYDLVVTWDLIEQCCVDNFIFKSARPAVREAETEAGQEPQPPPATEEECPTQILMLGEARGAYLGEACQGGCQVVLHLDDGQELRLDNEGERRLNPRETLGQIGGRVAVIYEQARSWNGYRGLCEIRDRLVSGRPVETAAEAALDGSDEW